MKLLIGITSSIAAYRIPNLISTLTKKDYEIKTIVTEKAKAFVAPQALSVMSQNPCYDDRIEWGSTERVYHIELARWCDVCMISPLTANTLAKIVNGICDNLLTSTVRALGDKPLILAPAMNTKMWENPITKHHLELASKFYNTTVIPPVPKRLADGEVGIGGLADDQTIIEALSRFAAK
ncbi:MAG: phosphopantothenoylcysteine decarboxylase [Calditrichaeota bacterium]|nr:phosphopantothenoylcysteine decarboxylase [Calditrichota bacterium]